MFAWQGATGQLTLQSDSDWSGVKSTRKSVSDGNIRFGQHLLRSWSKDQTVTAMSSGEAELYAASRCHGVASGQPPVTKVQMSHFLNSLPANDSNGRSGAGSCARKAGHPDATTVGKQHGRSWDEGLSRKTQLIDK